MKGRLVFFTVLVSLVLSISIFAYAHTVSHNHNFGWHGILNDSPVLGHSSEAWCYDGAFNYDTVNEIHFHYERANSTAPWQFTHSRVAKVKYGFGLC